MDFEKQIEELENQIYKLDEACDLLCVASEIIEGYSDYTDLVSDVDAVKEELRYRINELSRTLRKAKEQYDNHIWTNPKSEWINRNNKH